METPRREYPTGRKGEASHVWSAFLLWPHGSLSPSGLRPSRDNTSITKCTHPRRCIPRCKEESLKGATRTAFPHSTAKHPASQLESQRPPQTPGVPSPRGWYMSVWGMSVWGMWARGGYIYPRGRMRPYMGIWVGRGRGYAVCGLVWPCVASMCPCLSVVVTCRACVRSYRLPNLSVVGSTFKPESMWLNFCLPYFLLRIFSLSLIWVDKVWGACFRMSWRGFDTPSEASVFKGLVMV